MKSYMLIVLTLFLSACTLFTLEAERLHVQVIQAIVDGDAMKSASFFSNSYIDFGDGAKSLDENYFNSVFATDYYKNYLKGKKVEDLFDMNKKEVYNYRQIMRSKYKDYGKPHNFEFEKGDYLVFYPHKEGSGMYEGFIAVYRIIDGKFKIVAGD